MLKLITLSFPLFAVAGLGAWYLVHSEMAPETVAAETSTEAPEERGGRWFTDWARGVEEKAWEQAGRLMAAASPEAGEEKKGPAAKGEARGAGTTGEEAPRDAERPAPLVEPSQKLARPSRGGPDALFGPFAEAEMAPVESPTHSGLSATGLDEARLHTSRMQAVQRQRLEFEARLARIGR